MSEYWVNESIFCPNCGNSLSGFQNNKPVADFYCNKCLEEFELKATKGVLGKRIVDGAYDSMVERLKASNNPNFFFLTYDKPTLKINNFLTIPKYFFVEDIIQKRNPLSETARRAGWVGCNIMMENIPEFGKIFYVQNGVEKSRDEVLNNWNRTKFIKGTYDIEAKGWMLDILNCIDRIKKRDFSLEDVYQFQSYLKAKHPLNNNIQAKIRQQLQFLRDKGVIDFIGRGLYQRKT